jgi:hypothetical protein
MPVRHLNTALQAVRIDGIEGGANVFKADAIFVERRGISSTRTVGRDLPLTATSPTPSTCDSFWANTVEAAS